MTLHETYHMTQYMNINMGVSKNNGTPKYKLPILGYPHSWKHPYTYIYINININMTYIYQVLAWWADTNYISIYGVMILSGIQERFVTHLRQKHIYAKHTSVSIVLWWTLTNGKSHCLSLGRGLNQHFHETIKLSVFVWVGLGHTQAMNRSPSVTHCTIFFALFLAWLGGSGKDSFLSIDDLVCSVCR